ncbi:EamA family transporter [Pseudoxanthomonas japonensis]|jgi:transporter family protein|uniref:EamA family transporter n=1 Tax=Pseudoxanthomonas japonensis TaxID=69284 RepID=UPI00374A0CCC
MPTPDHWLLWALLSAVFAALTAVLAKLGVKDVDADLAMALRTLVVTALVVPLVWITGKWTNPLQLPARTLGYLVLSALATGASWLCYFRALQVGEAFRVAPVDKLSVVLVAVFAFFLLGERPSPKDWLGIGLMVAGLLLLVIRKG